MTVRKREIVRVFWEGKDVEDEIELVLDQTGEQACIVAIYVGMDAEKIKLDYKIRVVAPKAKAEIRVFGVLMGKAEKELKMELDFGRGSVWAVGEEMEDSLNLSDGVVNRTWPMILSAEQTATGKHGVKVGRIDEEQLSYLRQRGLETGEARKLLIKAKLKQALGWIEDQEIREKFRKELDGKLALDFYNKMQRV